MATAADLNSEPNFIVHWMSNASRAGVIVNPSFHVMKTNRDKKSSETVNIISHPIKMLHVSNSSCSISEDAIHEEQILESGSPCGLQLDTTETTFPAFHLVKKKTMLALKDAPALGKAPKTDSVCDEVDDQNEADYSDPLLQKLEQLKEIQQQKQEQLKKQQMEQLQRLMEEQKKLFSMVSGWQGLPERELLQKLNNKECILSLKSSLSSDSICEKQCLDASLKRQNGLKNEDHKNTTGESTWCPKEKMEKSVSGEDSDIDHLHSGNVDFSESPNGRKCLRTANTEERPIKAGIQERKQTFEEFLEEQIQLEDQRLKQKAEQQEVERSTFQKPLTKRPFLKRGEGLTRFTNGKSKVTKYKESKLMTQQSASEDRNIVKEDRLQIQRKTAPLSKEQISENFAVPFKKCNRVAKTTNGSVFPAQKAMILKNHNGKTILPSTVRAQTKKALDGQFRDSFRSEINSKLENKENIMEFEIGSKFRNKFADIKKPQLPTEFTNTFSLSKCSTSCPVKDSELSFELSFQNKLENWEKEKEKENIELDEFLFLEQAADEISFSSNSSFVQRILDQDQQISKGRRMSSTPVKAIQQQQMNALDVINNTNKKEMILQGNKNDRAVTNSVLDSRASFRLRDQFSKTDDKIFQTSIAATPTLKSTEWNVNEDKDDGSSVNTTESEEELETTLKCANKDAKKDILSRREDNPEFCDCTGPIKDVSKESKCRDVDLDLSDKDYSSDESSVLPNHSNSKISDSQRSVSCINRNKAEFDDERTWTDLEENESLHEVPQNDIIEVPPLTDYCNKIEMAAPDKTIKRKVASIKKGDDLPKQSVTDGDASAPPTSDLMMKLFPSLKPKQKPDCHARHETKSNVGQEEPGGDIVRSQVLREKLVELETEIERFRAENASLTKLREERESSLENLRREIADFEQQKTKELARIEEVKKEEMRKLQKERKVFEKYATAARAMPDKKERDEIQALKQQLADFQEDLKRREAKWSTTHGRLRNQIETLTKENTELREEIKIMERFRLEVWKKAEAGESNRKAESTGMNVRRAESISPPTRLQKSQILFPVPQTEKHSKMNGKGYSPAKGKTSRKPKSAPVSDKSNFDKTMTTLEDSSRTFMDMSPTEICVPSEPSTPVSTGSEEIQGEINYPDGKVEKVLKNGCHFIFFPNGTRKEVSSDGKTITVTFFNGDVKQVMPDQRVIYYYADAQTTHTTYPDGLEVLHFSNGQIEKHYPDGRKEITFPDQTIKNLFMDGREESIFPDGTIVRVQRDGSKTIEFNNGQRELHTSQFKRREYPDGTVKTVYANGHQETKYVCGRVRVKDKDGNVIMDTKL
ncbi:centromere protein J isoform X2 [Emydura macquarii macquarii]|uniref:centromere protein J isoform X2 n=1 Tax=Emydura macquarii macquarii TaxID=1129001 RepID=UPI00352B87F5